MKTGRILLPALLVGVGVAGYAGWRVSSGRAERTRGDEAVSEYGRVLFSTPDRFTDEALFAVANGGNSAASDALVLRRSPLVERLGEGRPITTERMRLFPFDVPRDATLRPIPTEAFVREVTERGKETGNWDGLSLRMLWIRDPNAARGLTERAVRDPRSDWTSLDATARLERGAQRRLGEIYLRIHMAGRPEREIAACIEALAWLSEGQVPTVVRSRPEELTVSDRWEENRPKIDPATLSAAEAERIVRARVLPKPSDPYDYDGEGRYWSATQCLVARDPARMLTLAPMREKEGIAARILRSRPGLTAATLPALTALVRARRTDPEWLGLRWSPLAYRLDPTSRRDWDSPLGGRYAQDRMLPLVDIWSELEPAHRERLLALAARPRHWLAGSLATALISRAPRDPRIVEFVGWALRTPKYNYRGGVILLAAAQGFPEAVAIVRAAVASPNPMIRVDARNAPDELSAPLVRDPSPYVRAQVALALLGSDSSLARERARLLREDPDATVRKTVRRLDSEYEERARYAQFVAATVRAENGRARQAERQARKTPVVR